MRSRILCCETFLLGVLKSVCCYIYFGVALNKVQPILISDSFSLCCDLYFTFWKFLPFFIPSFHSSLFWDLILLKPHHQPFPILFTDVIFFSSELTKHFFSLLIFKWRKIASQYCEASAIHQHESPIGIQVSFPSLTFTNHFYVSFSYDPWSVCF